MLSLRAYAKHRKELGLPGGTLRAVQKAIRDQRIPTVDGKIDPVQADAAWHSNTNPLKQSSPQRLTSEVEIPSEPTSCASEAGGAAEAAAAESRSGKLLDIKIKQEALKFREQKRNFLLDSKRLVDGRKVKAEMIERAAAERQALLNIPKRWASGLATELGVEERKVYHALSACVRKFLTERSSVPVDEGCPVPGSLIASSAMDSAVAFNA